VNEHFIHVVYMAAAACFILALKWLSAVPTAKRGVITGIIGMLLAVGGTVLAPEIRHYLWILVAFAVGGIIGVPMALMPMTAVPQRTALSHAFGALAAALVGTAEYYLGEELTHFKMTAIGIEVLLGFLTFTASLVAFGKLQEIIPTRPITYRGQNIVNLACFTAMAGCLIGVFTAPSPLLFAVMTALSFAFGHCVSLRHRCQLSWGQT